MLVYVCAGWGFARGSLMQVKFDILECFPLFNERYDLCEFNLYRDSVDKIALLLSDVLIECFFPRYVFSCVRPFQFTSFDLSFKNRKYVL